MAGSAGSSEASSPLTCAPIRQSSSIATDGRSSPGFLSRDGRCDLYTRTLAHAWRWTAGMPWQDRPAVDGLLVATNALTDSTDAERSRVRLDLP